MLLRIVSSLIGSPVLVLLGEASERGRCHEVICIALEAKYLLSGWLVDPLVIAALPILIR